MSGAKFISSYGRYFFLSNIPRVESKPPILRNFIKANLFKPTFQSQAQVKFTQQTRSFHNTSISKFINVYNYNFRNNYSTLKKALIFSGLFITATTVLTPYLFQIPPFNYFKSHPTHLVYTLVGINCAIFGLWQVPKFWRVLSRYALLEKNQMYSSWSAIGSAFSHQEIWHLGMNMLALYSFGTSLVHIIGVENFTMLYLNGAILSSIGSIVYPILFKIPISAASLGASGALFSVFGAFSYLIPHAKIMLFVFPIPGGAWFAFLGSMVWNLSGVFLKWGKFDYAAHTVGGVFGVMYAWYLKEKSDRQRAKRLHSYGFR
ncbi:hypothetical protein WICMUC_005948 [Wickerhamomyces mucosus]|uniref:Peptidase S54 rhomboid domain-containing protein n=1 Tax=Wickerhamomyces mucosus TaxID=1378264 RepID=A0A9P8P1C9_9ASCO|nr:hypothetical protein WICMUC_005948 [Wickerhamomyces mucosus]